MRTKLYANKLLSSENKNCLSPGTTMFDHPLMGDVASKPPGGVTKKLEADCIVRQVDNLKLSLGVMDVA